MNKSIFLPLYLSLVIIGGCTTGIPKPATFENRNPAIFPDFSSLVIPVNIAPLNFSIEEDGDAFLVAISGKKGDAFSIKSRKGDIRLPYKKWKELLSLNKGDSIRFEIFVKKEGLWKGYQPVRNYVSPDSIDPTIVYRKINPALLLWTDMAIMQRSTESFDEWPVLENTNTNGNCVHCHTFQNHKPDHLMLHLRTPPSGTYIHSGNTTRWLDTKTPYTIASFAYPSWHPNKNFIAFSTNKIHQFIYGSGQRLNYVYDDVSDIVIYDIEKNEVFTSPKIAGNDLENLPSWSQDGKTLYYINCPAQRKVQQGERVQYDLMQIPFNPETREFGEPDTLLTSTRTGLSITFPEASPDGRYIVFCMADYGYFTIGNTSSDLYILDLRDKSYRKLDINSNQTESWHNWSSNGKWLVFASKREDGIITLPYITHIDSSGFATKPFVLPAKDPETLITRLFNYNRPIFVNGRITVPQEQILTDIFKPTNKVNFDTIHVPVDSLSGIKSKTDPNEATIYRKN